MLAGVCESQVCLCACIFVDCVLLSLCMRQAATLVERCHVCHFGQDKAIGQLEAGVPAFRGVALFGEVKDRL